MGRTSVSAVLIGTDEASLLGPQVAANSIPVVLASGQPAGATSGLLFGVISAAASGDNTLLAASATKKIKLVSYVCVAAAAVSVKFKSGAATDLAGAMAFAANGGVAMSGSPQAHLLETAVNAALVLNLSAAVQVSGHFSYFLEA